MMRDPSGDSGAASDVLYEGRDLEVLSDVANYNAWIYERFRPHVGGATVEFGSGIGTISRLIRPDAARLDLVEPSANLLPALRARFSGDDAVTIHGATLEDFVGTVGDRHYDTVVLVNVLEHIEDDAAAVADFFRVLRPGGHLLVFVPALPWLYSRIDDLFGHYRRYRKAGLGALVADAGFECRSLAYFDAAGVLPWWLIHRVMGAQSFNPRMTRIYDRMVVPVSRTVERFVTPPAGKNLALVARRPA